MERDKELTVRQELAIKLLIAFADQGNCSIEDVDEVNIHWTGYGDNRKLRVAARARIVDEFRVPEE